MNTNEQLTYRTEAVPDLVWEAAADAASQCGYDQFQEELLDYEILDVQWVAADEVKALFPDCLKPPCSFSADEIVRVDWQTWAIQKRFDGRYEKAVVERVESIVVAVSTLMNRAVFTYGLGPEYNWLEWQEGQATGMEPTNAAFEALAELIAGEWRDEVREASDGAPAYLDDIHPKLQVAVAEVLNKVLRKGRRRK